VATADAPQQPNFPHLLGLPFLHRGAWAPFLTPGGDMLDAAMAVAMGAVHPPEVL
jgi:hypothetical protein